MGKYQLDDKGKAQVTRYHEKHSKGGVNKKARVTSLREQFLQKAKKNKGKSEVCMKLVSLSFYQGVKYEIKTTKIGR
ncbi:hypothetical protein HMPREF1042_2141 [Streptococcus constellatus subsp. pharyngis SK1060 = CCUG 46377]|uniref:30S ribosomal protein S10 n=1 Tax=Streptococcus constellatus subsp. pharyngis SK1060 = CCUG 46377 TaxID=1035184 RepID=F9PA85_STRCV|nr:hypothetical protein HMPREF1042_2141 [Streptococcus constellatus subsp. pharyngis SK1060 = CCUG 46377]